MNDPRRAALVRDRLTAAMRCRVAGETKVDSFNPLPLLLLPYYYYWYQYYGTAAAAATPTCHCTNRNTLLPRLRTLTDRSWQLSSHSE